MPPNTVANPLSRGAALGWAIVLIIASFGCGLMSAISTHGTAYPTHLLIANAIGGGSVPALIPLIWWACLRFRADQARRPLMLWGILIAVVAYAMWVVSDHRQVHHASTILTDVKHICPSFSDFCLTFPGQPTLKVLDIVIEGEHEQLTGHRYEYTVSDEDGTYLRAEFIPFSYFNQISMLTDAEIRERGSAFAANEELSYIEIFVETEMDGRVLVVRGSKFQDGVSVKIFNRLYYGPSSLLHMVTAGISSSFPSKSSTAFFGSVRRHASSD